MFEKHYYPRLDFGTNSQMLNPEAGGPEQMFAFGWDCRKPFLQAKLLRCSASVGLPN